MRRFYLFIFMLCLCGRTLGQTVDEILSYLPPTTKVEGIRYWFDEDIGNLSTLTQNQGTQTINVSGLVEGMHTLHCQIIDDSGAVASPHSIVFLKFTNQLEGTGAGEFHYWFDDSQAVRTIAVTSGIHILDVTDLLDGIHTIHYQVVNENGKTTPPYSQVFMKIAQYESELKPTSLLYWFDDETEEMQTISIQTGVQILDASVLMEGLHTIHYQVVCSDGSLTSTYSSIFLRMNKDSERVGIKELRYWFDDEAQAKVVEAISGVQMLDASGLPEGLHTLHYQVVDDTRAVGTPCSAVFLKMDLDDSQQVAYRHRYWFDEDLTTMKENEVTTGTQFLDATSLPKGLHTVHYQLIDGGGKLSSPQSSVFVKFSDRVIESGKNTIIEYVYWMNDDTKESVHNVLPTPESPYHLMTLLPTIKAPIRTTDFVFEIKDGQPTMYAHNDFHIRFVDAAGYMVEEARSFTDYNVSQSVTDITPLETKQTFERPTKDDIKWFTFETLYGDSIALKSNQPTSIQVFDATGKEVYATSADKSVRYGGCHLLTNGTCYVAVHDVTGTGNDITLDVQFIDKYAVFEYTPVRLASSGKALMTFKGNGLEHVKKVELTDGEKTFAADTIVATTDNMMARFSLDEQMATSQLYTLNLYFHNAETDESKTISYQNGVALEPANNVPLMAVEIVTEKRVGDPYPIKVTLKNEGNVPQYCIPVNIAFDNVDKLDEFLFIDFELLLSDSLYKCREFCTYTNNLVGTGENGFFLPLIIPYMGPNEIRTYTFGVRTKIPHASFNFYAWAGRPWGQSTMKTRSQQNSNMHDVYNVVEIVDQVTELPVSPAGSARTYLGAGEAIAGIIQGSTLAREDAVFAAYGIDPSEHDQYRFQFKNSVRSPRDIAADVLGLPDIGDVAEGSEPNPTPHLVDVYIPGDPNEMTGYEAPSGSRYMKDNVMTVGYDIEFENDPEIANSAAHSIVIENQLDPTKFDLKTFTPKDITISGNKVELDGAKSFVQTLDLRPKIDAIAELQCAYNVQTGLIRWTFTSLDPMTMEPTDDIMQGVLPVNYDGTSGIGNVTYTVNLLKTFPDGTEIPNKASIIFDNNEPIETPLWVNTIDAVTPHGLVDEVVLKNDTTATIHCTGCDERAGVWKYEVYVKYGSGELWDKVGECLADSAFINFRVYDNMDYGFCALAVDSAGNVEVQELEREYSLITYQAGDANGDKVVDIEDVVTAVSYFLDPTTPILFGAANVMKDDRIDIEDVVGISTLYLSSARSILKAAPVRMRQREANNNQQEQ